MNDRQRYALTNPLDDARDHDAILKRRSLTDRGDGTMLVVVLAVDR